MNAKFFKIICRFTLHSQTSEDVVAIMDRHGYGYKMFTKIGSVINKQDFHEAIRVSPKPWMIPTDGDATAVLIAKEINK